MTSSENRPPVLVIVRGNSGSGKTTAAREVRRRYGRGCALVEQDYLRRIILREHDGNNLDPHAPTFIATTVTTLLGFGYHVVLEGILRAERYGQVLRRLLADHHGPSAVYYIDLTLEETERRHQGRAHEVEFGPEQMRDWYLPHDILGTPGEHILDASRSLDETAATILHTSGLAGANPQTACPTRCANCAA
jgi:predicted kinase